jgi:hypothetical protein
MLIHTFKYKNIATRIYDNMQYTHTNRKHVHLHDFGVFVCARIYVCVCVYEPTSENVCLGVRVCVRIVSVPPTYHYHLSRMCPDKSADVSSILHPCTHDDDCLETPTVTPTNQIAPSFGSVTLFPFMLANQSQCLWPVNSGH